LKQPKQRHALDLAKDIDSPPKVESTVGANACEGGPHRNRYE
jgi:hypothetical protein